MSIASLLLAAILAHHPISTDLQARSQTITGEEIACVTEPRSVVHHNRHAFVCLSLLSIDLIGASELKGAVLSAAGKIVCPISGSAYVNNANETCVQLVSGCGINGSSCQ